MKQVGSWQKSKIAAVIACIQFICFNAWSQQEINAFPGLKLNEIQVIGSHNSYKPGIEPALWKILFSKDSSRANALQYGHIPISKQLDLGLRNLELDVVHDPEGGRYANPEGLALIKKAGGTPEPFDIGGDLKKPGLKVFHIPDFDFRSHHLLFIDCLRELHQWSKDHPGHLPIIITINAKDGNENGKTILLPFTGEALDSIDFEIRSVFNGSELITPDLIRGNESSLETAVLKHGWPALEKIGGRFLFVLDETGDKLNWYKNGHFGLADKILFVNEKEGSPEAAFMIINNPLSDHDKIKSLVRKGYMVRTRADANTTEARKNDLNMFMAAMESGAQVITTDYYIPSKFFNSPYKVVFKNGNYSRENPVK